MPTSAHEVSSRGPQESTYALGCVFLHAGQRVGVSIVTKTVAWPNSSWTTFGCTPAFKFSTAHRGAHRGTQRPSVAAGTGAATRRPARLAAGGSAGQSGGRQVEGGDREHGLCTLVPRQVAPGRQPLGSPAQHRNAALPDTTPSAIPSTMAVDCLIVSTALRVSASATVSDTPSSRRLTCTRMLMSLRLAVTKRPCMLRRSVPCVDTCNGLDLIQPTQSSRLVSQGRRRQVQVRPDHRKPEDLVHADPCHVASTTCL